MSLDNKELFMIDTKSFKNTIEKRRFNTNYTGTLYKSDRTFQFNKIALGGYLWTNSHHIYICIVYSHTSLFSDFTFSFFWWVMYKNTQRKWIGYKSSWQQYNSKQLIVIRHQDLQFFSIKYVSVIVNGYAREVRFEKFTCVNCT